MGRRLFLLALATAACLAGPGAARAAIPLAPCRSEGVQCGTVVVPLDRSGRVGGTVSLHVEVLPAQGTSRGTMFLVAGGPGQGSAGSFNLGPGFTRDLMRFMFPNYTLVAFDNRGTGQSGLINCPALQNSVITTAERGAQLAADCAGIIGASREFYATRDHAEDVDAVRAGLGYDKIGLTGVSYGTKLSLAYALAHPDRVDRLVLDSVVQPEFPDPFYRNVLRQMPDTLDAFCAGNVCRGATRSYSADVTRLANRIQAKPLQAKIIGTNGRAKTMRMNGEELLSMLIDTDLSPGLAAEAPAAVRAALGGNARPLLRIYDLDLKTGQLAAEDLSFGLNAATNCLDGRFPWAPSTPPTARQAAIDAAVAAMPAGSFGPFGAWATRIGTAYYCEQWPSPSGNTPLGPGPLPNVPMVAINGDLDLRTPVSNAVNVVNRFPQGKLLVVPGVGHSVLTADLLGCSQNYVRRWILGTLVAPDRAECATRAKPLVKMLAAFPRKPGRPAAATTLAVAGKTLREAQATWFQLLFSTTSFVPRGIYGGKLTNYKNGDGFTLARYSIIPGVALSGRILFADLGPPATYRGTIKVSGSAAVAGTLKIAKNGRVTGTLGGRRVSGRY